MRTITLSEDAKHIVASNLAVAAAMIQLANATKGKTTTSHGEDEAANLYKKMLERLDRG